MQGFIVALFVTDHVLHKAVTSKTARQWTKRSSEKR